MVNCFSKISRPRQIDPIIFREIRILGTFLEILKVVDVQICDKKDPINLQGDFLEFVKLRYPVNMQVSSRKETELDSDTSPVNRAVAQHHNKQAQPLESRFIAW